LIVSSFYHDLGG